MKIRNNNVAMILMGVALTIGASSCSIFKPSANPEGSGKGLQGWVDSSTGEVLKDASAVNNESKKVSAQSKKDAEKLKKDAVKAKKDAEKTMAKVDEKLQQIAELPTTATLSGDWAIETVLGKKAVGETAPFLKFVPAEGMVYGNNGCNTLNANYNSSYTDKAISFSNLATTMMLCAESNITDVEIGQALGIAVRYDVSHDNDSESILNLYDKAGNVVMTLMHRDFHFLDGTWKVVAIDGETVNIDDMKIALDVDEKKLHGNTGCNIINGLFETDMDTANSISFSKIAMTKMACPNSGWETRMMMALEEAITAKKLSKDEVEFIGSNDRQVMLLKKSSPIED